MSKAGRKKNGDDVLRAGDMVPPFDGDAGGAKKKTSRKKASASKKTGKVKAKLRATKSAVAGEQGNDIPQLDLDKRILAKERKVASVRRKGPGARSKAPGKTAEAVSADRRASRAVPELSGEDRVIAEIVARDIQRLCKR